MRKFKNPLKDHDVVQKWCVDVQNIVSSEKFYYRGTLEASEVSHRTFKSFASINGSQLDSLISQKYEKVHGNLVGGWFLQIRQEKNVLLHQYIG